MKRDGSRDREKYYLGDVWKLFSPDSTSGKVYMIPRAVTRKVMAWRDSVWYMFLCIPNDYDLS